MDPIEDRKRAAQIPQMRSLFGYSASMADSNADLATRRYEYALEQRDKLNERIRFGCLTLNAASLLALGSLVGNDGKLAVLGLSHGNISGPAGFFGVGLALGAVAIWSNGVHFTLLAAEAFQYRIDAAHRRALFDNRTSERAEQDVSDELAKPLTPMPDFAFSKWTMALTNSSGSCWLAGLSWIIGALYF